MKNTLQIKWTAITLRFETKKRYIESFKGVKSIEAAKKVLAKRQTSNMLWAVWYDAKGNNIPLKSKAAA